MKPGGQVLLSHHLWGSMEPGNGAAVRRSNVSSYRAIITGENKMLQSTEKLQKKLPNKVVSCVTQHGAISLSNKVKYTSLHRQSVAEAKLRL